MSIEGLTLKKAPAHATFETGLYKGNRMKFGIFIMPDGRSKGCLETLCWRSVEDSTVGGCVEGYIDCRSRSRKCFCRKIG